MKYRREIDGLRAVAVLPVILFHAGFEAFAGGFVGVDVFFVISGYLITTIILSDMNNGKFSIVTFYERRARRILPALFFVMFCCLPFAWFWLLPNHLKDFAQSLTAITGFSSNILFWRESGYFGTAGELKPLLHTWSLAVEEQYYVLFPLFLMALWKLRKRWIFGSLVVVAISSLILAQWGAYNKPTAAFFLLPTRGWELAIGALIAFYFLNKKEQAQLITSHKASSEALGALGLALIGYSIFVFDHSTPFPGVYALIPTLGTALIIIFATADTVVGRLLSTKSMVGIGLISYSTYLWHQPLFAFARHRSMEDPSVTLLLVLSVMSIVLAYLSWRFVEMPFRDKKAIGRKKVFVFAVVGSVAFAAIGLGGHFTNVYSLNYPKIIEMHDYAQKSRESGSCADILRNSSLVSSACQIGAKDKNASFIVFGDSHARSLVSALSDISSSLNVSGLNYSFNSCPPLFFGNHVKKNADSKICAELRKDFFENLTDSKIPDYVILLQRWTLLMEKKRIDNQEGGVEHGEDYLFTNISNTLNYQDALEQNYVESVRKILDSGRKVVLVYPVPEMGWNVPDLLMKKYFIDKNIKISDASTSQSVFKKRNFRAYQALDSIGLHKNLIRIIPEKLFCDNYLAERCVAHVDSIPLYYDDDHLSYMGAKFVVDEIMKKTNNFEH